MKLVILNIFLLSQYFLAKFTCCNLLLSFLILIRRLQVKLLMNKIETTWKYYLPCDPYSLHHTQPYKGPYPN